MVMVRHKSASVAGSQPGAPEAAPEGDKKKEDADKGKADDKKDEKKEGGDKPEAKAFTEEEDAKLKELKAANTTWKNIAQEMGKPLHEIKTRWKEIEGKPGEAKDGDAKKEEAKGGDDKKKDEGAASGDFTAADDEKIKEMLATGTGFKKIADALGRKLDGPLKEHINKLKAEGGGEQKKDAPKDEKKDEKQGEKKDEGEKPGDFTAADDEKIKELLAANTPYKQIASDLGRKLDKNLKDHLKKLKDEGAATEKKETPKAEKKQEEKPKEDSKKDKAEKKEEAKPASKPASKAPSRAPSVARSHRSRRSNSSHGGSLRFTAQEWLTLMEDEVFSFAELQLLVRIVGNNPGRSWLRIASVFMDKTGRRVHPEDIREKFEEVGVV